MANVTEHDGEQERERDDGEQAGVDLLVRADAVRIDDVLEALGELVRAVERRRGIGRSELVQQRRDRRPGVLLLPARASAQDEECSAHVHRARTDAFRRAPWTCGMSLVGTQPSATSVFLPWSHFHKFKVEKMTFSLRTRAHHAEIESAILTSSARRVWFVLYRTELRSSIREVTSRSLSERLSDDESIAKRFAPMAAEERRGEHACMSSE